MRNNRNKWKTFFLQRAPGFLFVCIIVFASSVDCRAQIDQVAVQPQLILSDQTCPVCGMYPARYPKWHTQIIFHDGQSVAFDGSKDMFRFFLNPSAFAPQRTREDIAAVLVRDFNSGTWIDGQQAYFIVASNEFGPMGMEIIPFADRKDAQSFIDVHGGQFARFMEINGQTLETLAPDGDGHHTEHLHHGAHEPIGVMGGHIHGASEWMVSYRFMRMDMDGNRKGTSRVSTSDVLTDFMVAPLNMTMDMHMFGLMYAPTNTLTLMAMVPYLDIEMDHVTRMGNKFTTESDGIGDIKVSALYSLLDTGNHKVHLNAAISLPTGDIDQEDDTPAGPNQKLPYPMQLGSGTWDLLPGITYSGQDGAWSWGSQALATIRLGENSNDYTLGNRLNLTGWVGHQLGRPANMTLRLDGQTWGNIDGADPDLNPMMVPTADPDRRGGTRLDLLAGVDYMRHSGALTGNRLAIEGGVPIYQDLDGPQLETDWLLTVGWQFMW